MLFVVAAGMLPGYSPSYTPVAEAMKGYEAEQVPPVRMCFCARRLFCFERERADSWRAVLPAQPYYQSHLPAAGWKSESVVVSHPIVMDPTEVCCFLAPCSRVVRASSKP